MNPQRKLLLYELLVFIEHLVGSLSSLHCRFHLSDIYLTNRDKCDTIEVDMWERKTTEDFVKDARRLHHNKYDYSKSVYFNNRTTVIIRCHIHGDFHQTPSNHLQMKGCPKCKNDFTKHRCQGNREDFILKAEKVHLGKYDYSNTKYVNNHTKIMIKCPWHSEFLQTPNDHLRGKGCAECSANKKKDNNAFILLSRKIHGDKYDYSKINYINIFTQVIITCPSHGEFQQTPDHHLHGNGCPKCKSSKGEMKIMRWLENNKVKYITQKSFVDCKSPRNRLLKFDFYIPDKNLLIEFDGAQHFNIGYIGQHKTTQDDLDRLRLHDKIKTDYSVSKNIKLIRIPHTEINHIDKILCKELL